VPTRDKCSAIRAAAPNREENAVTTTRGHVCWNPPRSLLQSGVNDKEKGKSQVEKAPFCKRIRMRRKSKTMREGEPGRSLYQEG